MMKHSKEALSLLVDQWLDTAHDLSPSGSPVKTSDIYGVVDAAKAQQLRACAVELRAILKEMS